MLIEDNILKKVYPSDIINGIFTLPDDVTSIGGFAFQGCTSLAHIVIDVSNQRSFERIQALLPQVIRERAIIPTHFLNQVSLESGSERDSAINLLIKGHKPDDEANNELYQHWLDFREQVLKTPRHHARQVSTLQNLCLFAVKKGLKKKTITDEQLKPLGLIKNRFKTPKTPDTPNQILEAFND